MKEGRLRAMIPGPSSLGVHLSKLAERKPRQKDEEWMGAMREWRTAQSNSHRVKLSYQ